MLIETEPTPNPHTLKFRPGRTVAGATPREFADAEAAHASPLAAALFALGSVERVFFGADFVSVTRAADGPDWAELKPQVLAVLAEHFASGAPLLADVAAAEPVHDDPADAEIVARIRELLDTRIRPVVAGDGGDVVYRGFDRGVVYLHLQGSCAGCPSSTATLKGGIENLLRFYVPEVTEVRAV
ncbi:MAG: NifU family protein [Sphingomonadaceae bacterium]|uniref:NifU family protein n=1 Tax=Thermaurantiacus sp. TaxID=2820283 RepID=UPI00298EF9AE|nr:NifU family protein [Thermaurantiacus sp.]MCS6985923.1 NifU family protein [Sphingomonadaceae bacterium]MDW8414861.1 NifU family protein [Thermaurantiacus sp.]